MIRFLFFIALGGAVSLLLLSTSGSPVFITWGTGFGIAAVILLPLGILARSLKRNRKEHTEISAASASGRTVAAMILERRQTGLYVNEQPQVEFRLLVDRPGQQPFITKTRKIVSLLDVHLITPGKLLTVVHLNPDYGDISIVEEPTPTPSRWLTPEAAATAPELPADPNGRNAKGAQLSAVATFIGLFLVGFFGAPYVASPNAHEYVPHLFSGSSQEVQSLDHSALFDIENLYASFDSLTMELGHDEVYSVHVSDVWLTADAPVAPGDSKVDEVTIRNMEIDEREPAMIQPDEDAAPFSLFEVEWEGVLETIPEAEGIVAEQTASDDVRLLSILAERNSFTDLQAIDVRMIFETPYETVSVRLDAAGQLLPAEYLNLLPEEEQATYLFDADRMNEAVDEMVDATAAEQVTRMLNYGSWTSMDVYRPQSGAAGRTVEVEYRDGQIYDVGAEQATNAAPEDVFSPDDVDWALIVDALPDVRQAMEAEGAVGTVPQYIIVEINQSPSSEPARLVARVYVRNEADEGGYVELDTSGDIVRVSGP